MAQKLRLFVAILLFFLIMSVFIGCQSQNATALTELSASTQPANPTESTDDLTDPMQTETVGPRTVDFLKSHLTPYITYAEACALFGHPDEVGGNTFNIRYPRWDLEDGYFVRTVFYPTINETYAEYDATEPNKETNPDGTSVVWNLPIWFDHMEAYQAVLCKENPTGKGQAEIVEVWFEYPDPWYQGE